MLFRAAAATTLHLLIVILNEQNEVAFLDFYIFDAISYITITESHWWQAIDADQHFCILF